MILQYGPVPVDLAVPNSAARALLAGFVAEAQQRDWQPPDRPSTAPGLYLLVDTGGSRPAVAGFHLIFGGAYLEGGASGAPERAPPYVAALLEAATEAVWWREFAVAPLAASVWRPVVLLEWPSELAERSAFPPAGTVEPGVAEAEAEEDEAGTWLLPSERARPGGPPGAPLGVTPRSSPLAPGAPPGRRSLVAVVRAHLEHTATAHEGRYFLVGPDRFRAVDGPPVEQPLPLEEWIEVGARPAARAAPPGEHGLGPALQLPHGGIGYPLSGWLTRSLEVWPERAADVAPGTLARRDVRNDGIAQVQLAVAISALVFVPLLALALLVQRISAPEATASPALGLQEPQPAISVCSANHPKFVEEFRCQIEAQVMGIPAEVPVCSDLGRAGALASATGNLQPDYCGLLDDVLTGGTPSKAAAGTVQRMGYNPAEFAATQACFNVLGYPDPYRREGEAGAGPRVLGDPLAFLDSADLGIRPLQGLIADLQRNCDSYRPHLEARIEGAVFATHVGVAMEPGGAGRVAAELRSRLLATALAEDSETDQRCFRAGAGTGLDVASYAGVCGEETVVDPPSGDQDIWRELGAGEPAAGGIVARYVAARFVQATSLALPPLWACHMDLVEAVEERSFPGAWDLAIRVPGVYDVDAGGVRSQLELDAALSVLRTAAVGGSCWSVVSERLTHYRPVHPLLGAFDEGVPFSLEQQVCAQACAVKYQVRNVPADTWITTDADLALCVDHSAPIDARRRQSAADPAVPEDSAQPAFDRLRIPWNTPRAVGAPSRRPSTAAVCSFNLIAQGLLPAPEGGLLASGVDTVAWAGVPEGAARIAGGMEGAAGSAAINLSTYGGSRSRETCADAAAQCFVSLLLAGVEAPTPRPRHLWSRDWAQAVARVSTRGAGRGEQTAEQTPWCGLIAPYLAPTGALPEGELDYPCAKGVDEQRTRIAAMVEALASGGLTGATAGGTQ